MVFVARNFKYLYWLLALPLLLSGCDEKTYDYGFDTGGFGGSGWPIWVESLVINEAWRLPVGALSGGDADISKYPPGGKAASAGWVPLPHTVRVRWFSYRTQTFYEATAEVPKDKQKQIKQWFKKYPRPKYVHNLVTGIRGQGEIQLWWYAGCVGMGCPEIRPETYEYHYFELTPRIQATVAEGDARRHREGTKQEVEMGFLPPEVLDLILPGQDKSGAD
ncbi:DUF2931 family protein [Gynuella sunshinyii]|uniref:DUF2931 family protein n=1 Tax=Gynuella sunshinyii YC6258 TaxID=1445510 RepID=A0A0C5VUZ8_9GAMM|nr:DUF2931 family protein [Gynuella sunshinyii]AJQ97123.1 hypothetical Protein YC6258_05093 [Gynuella sunshinyii YC6258]